MIKEIWLYSAITAAFATVPPHLKGKVEMLDGGGNYSTEILPAVVGDKQYAVVGFCYITGNSPGETRYLSAPFATVSIFYPDKKVVWKDTKAIDFGLHPSSVASNQIESIGTIEREGISVGEFINARSRYPKLISKVMENRWLVTRHSVTAEERATAQELQECTRILYDKPLLPYYRQVGHHFLAWMERAAQ